jgi:hypothetical protein
MAALLATLVYATMRLLVAGLLVFEPVSTVLSAPASSPVNLATGSTLTRSTIQERRVITDNGFIFSVPKGWTVAWIGRDVGSWVAQLLNSKGEDIGSVECLPIARGFEGESPVSKQLVRSFKSGTTTYDISYQGYGTGNNIDLVLSFVYEQHAATEHKYECMVYVSSFSELSHDELTGANEIFSSWK